MQFQAASPGGRSLLAGHPDPELSDRVRRHGLTIWCGDPEATDEMYRSVASEVVRRAVQETRFLKGPGRSLVLTLRVQASDADKALVLGLKVCTLGMENWIEATLNDRFSAHLTADPARCSPPLNILTWDNASRQTLEASSFWIVVRFPPGWLLEGDNSIRLSLHCLSPTPRIVASVRPVWLFEVTAGPA
ncbi:MAG: hypothetical protein HY815_20915 [Candidatus Riflebacteria bacterium]|nr:hypothetical protein [Candidatus Riflebacteria bacterium]